MTAAKTPCEVPDFVVRQFSACFASMLTLGSRPVALMSAAHRAVSFRP